MPAAKMFLGLILRAAAVAALAGILIETVRISLIVARPERARSRSAGLFR